MYFLVTITYLYALPNIYDKINPNIAINIVMLAANENSLQSLQFYSLNLEY